MEKRMFTGEVRHTNTERAYRALAALTLSLSCFLTGCVSEKGADTGGSSSAPYGGSETTTSQPENSNTENPSQNKKDDSAGKIDIEKNSIYYSENGVREGFSAYCTARTYDGFPQMADCSLYLCDGDDTVRFTFDNVDFTEQTHGRREPKLSDLINNTRTLAADYRYYIPAETLKNTAECKEKKSNVGRFTKPVSFPYGENEQYLCLPDFSTTMDGRKTALKVTKTTSVNEEDNNGPRYPYYKFDLSEECFNRKAID